MKQQGVTLVCENCTCMAAEADGAFKVRVPVRSGETGATATLRCLISADRHFIDIVDWELEQGTPEASDALRREVATLLLTIAEKRVCGNTGICPVQVVRMVEHAKT
jgi:hypothetical protein